MRKTALKVLKEIRKRPLRIGEIAEKLGKSQGWVSNIVTDLEEENLVTKNRKVESAETYEAALFDRLQETYDLEKILAGKREDILKEILAGPKTVRELESRGFPKSTVYGILKDLKTTGVIRGSKKGYRITDENLKSFLESRKISRDGTVHSVDGEKVLVVENRERKEGEPTAFSAFRRYSVDYYPNKDYLYQGESELGPENILVHSILCGGNKKQMSMCGVFYLKNRDRLEPRKLWNLSRKWNCEGKLKDLLAFLDRREVDREELFLPWSEFAQIAKDYDLQLREKHAKERLEAGFEGVGELLEEKLEAYLIGGANLILRGLKDSTKDIDIILRKKDDFERFVEALKEKGYKEKLELERPYKEFEPRRVLEKRGHPRWDVFIESVANCIRLTEEMCSRSDLFVKKGDLKLNLISPTDIFLFKAVTNREGDLEDVKLLSRQEKIDWEELFEEIRKQEDLTEKYISFPVLDTLNILSDRYGINVPIRSRLESYCLEKALLITLEEPKTIKELREELDFPEHQIYNKLRKLEEKNHLKVDRSGELNEYVAK